MLDGFTVGITADRRSDEQASLFERRGAVVTIGRVIRTSPLGEDDGLRAATEVVIRARPDALVANTGLGIRSWFGAAESWDLGDALLDALRGTRVYARGPKAAGAVHALGLEVHARAESERLAECLDRVASDLAPGGCVVVQRDGAPSSPDLGALQRANATVVEVPVYRWHHTDDPRPALRLAEGVIAGRVHAVTFTCGPAVHAWMSVARDAGIDADLRDSLSAGSAVVGCVGPTCADAAASAGIGDGDIVVPRTSRLGPLVRAVSDRLVERSQQVGDLVITGTVVRCGGRRIELSDMDARLLAALARRPGAVVSKVDLLREVWGDTAADPHLVEVAIARLRRRLGSHAGAVTVVPRRGYVLR